MILLHHVASIFLQRNIIFFFKLLLCNFLFQSVDCYYIFLIAFKEIDFCWCFIYFSILAFQIVYLLCFISISCVLFIPLFAVSSVGIKRSLSKQFEQVTERIKRIIFADFFLLHFTHERVRDCKKLQSRMMIRDEKNVYDWNVYYRYTKVSSAC